MAVNHSVMLEVANGQQILSASSPDEQALKLTALKKITCSTCHLTTVASLTAPKRAQAFVAAAEHFGFEFAARDVSAGTLSRSRHPTHPSDPPPDSSQV